MKRFIFKSLLVNMFALGFVVSAQAQGANLIRKSAEFRFVGEDSTTLPAAALGTGGLSVYTKSVSTGPGENILYITISSTGDTHDGSGLLLSCNVDGVVCNPGGGGGGGAAPTGWIRIQKIPAGTGATNCNDGGGGDGDCHDNNISYQWCKTIPPILDPVTGVETGGPRTVNVRLASSDGVSIVFIEKSHYFIDATKGGSPTCTAGST